MKPFADVEIGGHLPGAAAIRARGIRIREGQTAVLADERSAAHSLALRDLPHDPRVGAELHLGVSAPEPVGAGPVFVLEDRPAHREE